MFPSWTKAQSELAWEGEVKPAISADALVPESERLRMYRLVVTNVPYILEHSVIAYGSGHSGISYVTNPGSWMMSEGGKKRNGEGPTVGDSLGEAGARAKSGSRHARSLREEDLNIEQGECGSIESEGGGGGRSSQ